MDRDFRLGKNIGSTVANGMTKYLFLQLDQTALLG